MVIHEAMSAQMQNEERWTRSWERSINKIKELYWEDWEYTHKWTSSMDIYLYFPGKVFIASSEFLFPISTSSHLQTFCSSKNFVAIQASERVTNTNFTTQNREWTQFLPILYRLLREVF